MSWLKRLFGKATRGHHPEAGPEPFDKSKPELRLSVNNDPLYRDAASFRDVVRQLQRLSASASPQGWLQPSGYFDRVPGK